MTEPERLLRGDGPGARLLRSASIDRPSDDSRERLLASLAPGAALVTVVATSSMVSLSRAALARWMLLSALVGGALGSGLVTLAHRASSARPVAPTALAAAPPVASVSSPSLTPSAPSSAIALVAVAPVVEAPVAVAAPPRAVVPSSRPASPEDDPPVLVDPGRLIQPAPARSSTATAAPTASVAALGLADEVAWLDRVRTALSTGDARGALALLDAHDASFPRALLAPEAAALRVTALDAAGQHRLAREQARSFVERFPRSPHSARLRALIDSSPHP